MKTATKKIIILIFSVIFLNFGPAAAANEHFSCGTDWAELSGRSFDNLYIDLNGCGTDVELSNLRVAGSLIYNGGNDFTDHNITISDSIIQNIQFPCENSHRCSLRIDRSDDIHEITAIPSGKEKGKIFLTGEVNKEEGKVAHLYRLNLITSDWNEEMQDSMNDPAALPASYEYTYAQTTSGDAEIELKDLNISELSAVNNTPAIYPSLCLRDYARIYLMAVYSPKLKMFVPETSDEQSIVHSLFTSVDGTNFELSVDSVFLDNFHFLGNNNQNSVLTLKDAYEKLHTTDRLNNVFIFGGNMDFKGYIKPQRGIPTLRRLIYSVQPEQYVLEPSAHILNDLLENYQDIAASATETGRSFMFPYAQHVMHEELMLGLTQKFAGDRPEIDLGWRPYVKMSYVNIMNTNVADSIREKVPQMSMFLIQNDSFMHGSRDVTRHGLGAKIGNYSNTLIHINEITALFDQLEEGCYDIGFDQYGNLVVK